MSGPTDPPGTKRDDPAPPAAAPAGERWIGDGHGLTERESEVLVLCARGLRNREIAEALFLNIETVKSHLKRAYSRLGIRNRAQAAAFVLHAGGDPIVDGRTGGADPQPVDDDGPLAPLLGLDAAALARRRHLLGLDAAAIDALRRAAPTLRPHTAAVVDELIGGWRQLGPLSRHVRDADAAARLAGHQHRYLAEVLDGDLGDAHLEAMLRTGAAHHRLGLEPQWYVAATGNLLCALLRPLFAERPGDDALEVTAALISALFLDASLVLDAYELAVAREISARSPAREADRMGGVGAGAGVAGSRGDRPGRAGPSGSGTTAVTRLRLAGEQVAERRAFLGLGTQHVAVLRSLRDGMDPAIDGALHEFYALIVHDDELAPLVPEDVQRRLLVEVARYWRDLLDREPDEERAVGCMRIGMVHERIGVAPQHYLAGLARQLVALLQRMPVHGPDGASLVDALVRSALFDATFVLDAYLEGRAARLKEGALYAGHIVASLGTGVAVVDARNRMEYANEQLLDLAGIPAGVLHRMPVEDAIGLAELPALLATARRSSIGRASVLASLGGNPMRVTAIHLHRAMTGREGVVALVLDDLSEVLRTRDELGYQQRTLGRVLQAARAIVWEAAMPSLTLLAVSPNVAETTGTEPLQLLGRAAWLELLHPDDRATLVEVCRGLAPGSSAQLDHRLRAAGGGHRWMRTQVVRSPDGREGDRISAVTVETVPPGP